MIAVIDSTECPGDLETYRQWVSGEWDGDHSFDAPAGCPPLPSPLLAQSDGALAGGLSFTWYPAPDTGDRALWINTLYVAPGCRGQGIALRLLEAAEQAAPGAVAAKELFVHTDVPDLYGKREWRLIERNEPMSVMRKELLP
jgi:GNAT superfamily N-acetyltransferase